MKKYGIKRIGIVYDDELVKEIETLEAQEGVKVEHIIFICENPLPHKLSKVYQIVYSEEV